jgi:hypothetical protein
MNHKLTILFLGLVFACLGVSVVKAQSPQPVPVPSPHEVQLDHRLSELERKVKSSRADAAGAGGVSFLFGAFCALWAQNSGRSAWLWFFLGLFFSIITVIFVLIKNGDDRFDKQQRERYTHGRT